MMLWNIIKRAVRDIEISNNIQFGDESWTRLKQMEAEIYQWQERCEAEIKPKEIEGGL